jgi:hypothetical protein
VTDRELVQRHLHEGVRCPTCDQFCKIYKRPINCTMAHALILIYRHFNRYPHGWLHVPEFLATTSPNSANAGGDVSKLRYWGLLQPKQAVREDGSDRVGLYRITPRGRAFVMGLTRVPKYALIYNQTLLTLSDEQIHIKDALGKRFNYTELMRG